MWPQKKFMVKLSATGLYSVSHDNRLRKIKVLWWNHNILFSHKNMRKQLNIYFDDAAIIDEKCQVNKIQFR